MKFVESLGPKKDLEIIHLAFSNRRSVHSSTRLVLRISFVSFDFNKADPWGFGLATRGLTNNFPYLFPLGLPGSYRWSHKESKMILFTVQQFFSMKVCYESSLFSSRRWDGIVQN